MASIALTGIEQLVTCDPDIGRGPLGIIDNATLVADEGRVVYAGPRHGAPSGVEMDVELQGHCVVPGYVDSHTHPVFAGDRAGEFARRMAGQPYAPGGILETVSATRAATRSSLEAHVSRLAREAMTFGTTTLEAKSGYGLSPEHEAAHLQVARTVTDEVTFLGAHLVPAEYEHDRAGYLELLTAVMLPAATGTARWCDVFCEEGAFDVDESRQILKAAEANGLGLRVHANQLSAGGGVALACELEAASADHCTHLTRADVDALATSGTVATLLPISDFCTRQPYADGRALIDAGATVALASNCNPGSSYSLSMPLAMALAVRECGLSVGEALWSATAGGAQALRRADIGRLSPGCRADALVVGAPSHEHLVYRLGSNLVSAVLKDGKWARGHVV
ncbi:MAG TPA: imidazolonepropionase [Acidimicrobiales bacterium]|nr:imidazolonepropionase [Acidimicrobiales bacterium]